MLLLLLCSLYDTKHSNIEASQHCCIHVCKWTSSTFLAVKADTSILQHSKDGLQITLSTSRLESLFDIRHAQPTKGVLRFLHLYSKSKVNLSIEA